MKEGQQQDGEEFNDDPQRQHKGRHDKGHHNQGHHKHGHHKQGHHKQGRGRDEAAHPPRERARRGDARYILLDALRDGPKHGYEIIKALEERSAGHYIPSPGTVYPTLQYLEDQGLVRSTQEAERRVFQLTTAGHAELVTQAEQVTAFWQRFTEQNVAAASQHEVTFLQDELDQLNRIVWNGLQAAIAQGQTESIRRVRSAIEECQNKVREVIATESTQ